MLWLLVALRAFGGAFIRVAREPETRALALAAALLLVIGTLFYTTVEGWSLLDALYFCVVTLATVGYGDFAPQTALGKVFTIFYVLSGIGVIVLFASSLAGFAMEDRTRHQLMRRRGIRPLEGEDEATGEGTDREPPAAS